MIRNETFNQSQVEQWEYHTEFVSSDTYDDNAKIFIKNRWPNVNNMPRHTPLAMIFRLNALGEEGWELVHMEPIPRLGEKGDVGYPVAGPGPVAMAGYVYSHTYFCVYKRRTQKKVSNESS
jgi:hypothetical protein